MKLDDVRPIHAFDVLVEGRQWPGLIHVIDHPDGPLLVDTGMIYSTPDIDEEWHPTIYPERIPREVAAVINTHLHFDHCGGNRLFPGLPIFVQGAEVEAARAPGYTIREWVDFDGATYVELVGESEIAPGVRVIPTPGHAPGHQSVLVETDEGLVIVGGDVGYTWKQFDERESGQALLALRPRRIWLAHQAEPRDI
jgi:Zn-dependent hydrolases, including glyoxylases